MKLMIILTAVLFSSCATWNNLFGEKEKPAQTLTKNSTDRDELTKYSDSPQVGFSPDRNYKRMTRAKLEEESELQAQAGSMWVMEGQMSYLFTQNKIRRDGDGLKVRLDGHAQKQIETKVGVIKKLLRQLEDQEKQIILQQQMAAKQQAEQNGERGPASVAPVAAAPAASSGGGAADPGATVSSTGGGGMIPLAPGINSVAAAEKAGLLNPSIDRLPIPEKDKSPYEEKEELAAAMQVQTRIIERLPDGNYKVKGSSPLMIGRKEYKVIVTGIIRPEEFNEEGVLSSRLIEPQYDVVHVRRKD